MDRRRNRKTLSWSSDHAREHAGQGLLEHGQTRADDPEIRIDDGPDDALDGIVRHVALIFRELCTDVMRIMEVMVTLVVGLRSVHAQLLQLVSHRARTA